MNFFEKIKRKWMKLRLQPIRVFCLHQVSEQYDPSVYCMPDWVSTSFIRGYIEQLQSEGVEFISLEEAYRHIKDDIIRTKKYAVLTADDGMRCQAELLPWLEQHRVPLTMFVDLETLDGKTCTIPVKNYLKIQNTEEERKLAEQLYLTKEQLLQLQSPMLSIGMHGLKHESVQDMNEEMFRKQVRECQNELSEHPSYIPYFAYPYGSHSNKTDDVLNAKNLVPVYADGNVNYNDTKVIHREIIDVLKELEIL